MIILMINIIIINIINIVTNTMIVLMIGHIDISSIITTKAPASHFAGGHGHARRDDLRQVGTSAFAIIGIVPTKTWPC